MRIKTISLSMVTWILLCTGSLAAQDNTVEVELAALPQSVEEFLAFRELHGAEPAGAAALFAAALIRYAEEPEAGLPMLVLILVNDGTLMQNDTTGMGYQGYNLTIPTRSLIDRILTAPWIARSYVQSTSPENQYTLPEGPARFTISTNVYSEVQPDEVRIFIASSGADSPRPLRLKRNQAGIWKVAEFSSIVVGIRPPVSTAVDDL